MTPGPKEILQNALKKAGFTTAESESLLAQWNSLIRPKLVSIIEDVANTAYVLVTNGHKPLTSETMEDALSDLKHESRALYKDTKDKYDTSSSSRRRSVTHSRDKPYSTNGQVSGGKGKRQSVRREPRPEQPYRQPTYYGPPTYPPVTYAMGQSSVQPPPATSVCARQDPPYPPAMYQMPTAATMMGTPMIGASMMTPPIISPTMMPPPIMPPPIPPPFRAGQDPNRHPNQLRGPGPLQ